MALPRYPIERTSMDLQPAPTGSNRLQPNYLINLRMRMQQVPAHLCIYHLDPFSSCAAWLVAAEMANQTQLMVASLNRSPHDQDAHCRTIIREPIAPLTLAGFLSYMSPAVRFLETQ